MTVQTPVAPVSWWAMPLKKLFVSLHTDEKGLTHEEAHHRLAQFGPNDLAKQKKISIFHRIGSKLLNPMIIILLVAGLLSAFLGQASDFIIILAIIFVSVTIDAYQEHSAQNAAEKLRKSVALTATVLRKNEKKEIPFTSLVPGDIVYLSSGDIVPADGALIEEDGLTIDQSSLTGESYPQHKHTDVSVASDAAVVDRVSSVFMGTHVVSGEGTMVVVMTGGRTELGGIAQSLVGTRPKTEFEKGILSYGYFLMKLILIIAPIVFLVHVGLAHNVLSSLLFVLALVVGFAPELLPVIFTINLSKGAIRMSQKGVIVKNLPAIENFGSMDVLCTDKTGTLTENSIELVSYEDIHGKKNDEVFNLSYLTSYFERGLENPLERAIIKHGKPALAHAYKKIFEVPFDFYRKRMSVVVEHNRKRMIITKGAPEKVVQHAQHYKDGNTIHPLTHQMRETIHKRFEALSRSGYRILAVAYREIGKETKYRTIDETDLIFVGLLSFLDPPKKSARDALQLLEDRGVMVKILTGDNELVTAHVCRELGLPVLGVATGKDIERIGDRALVQLTHKTTIFARLNPQSKRRVIEALRKAGHVVGYLGDGVNDAPSLRASDVGISVNNAVDVAKESADLILLHKDFHVLLDGVEEGRKTFSNVMKYIMMGMSSNFGNMFSVAIASLFLPFLPMLPVQILLNDLMYDASQLLLANDEVDESAIVKPKQWNIRFIRQFMLVFGPISSVFDCITFLVLLKFFHASPILFQTGWFLESIATQTLIILSIRTSMVPFYKSKPNKQFALSLGIVVAVALLLPFLPLAPFFSFVAPPPAFYLVLVAIVACYFVVVEVTKKIFYAHYVV